MTLTEASEKVQALRGHGKFEASQRGRDLVLKNGGGVDVIDGARALAKIFGTERIDFVIWEGEADVVVEDWGCDSCGYGCVIVIRGILDEAT